MKIIDNFMKIKYYFIKIKRIFNATNGTKK